MPSKRAAKKSADGSKHEALDTQLIKALSHPVRARALAILNERVASPKEIADELGLPVGNVSYHVNTLNKLGCVELVDRVPRRGATEHFYRGVTRSFLNDDNWARLDPDPKGGISIAGLKVINKHAKVAIEAGTFDSRDDRHLSCSPMTLDKQGWSEMTALLEETLERIAGINANAANRLADKVGPDEVIRATVALLGFESPPQCGPKKSPEEGLEAG